MKLIKNVLLALTIGTTAVVVTGCDDLLGGTVDTDELLNEILGISFENKSFEYDGTEKEITITGTLPEGVSVTYTNNKATQTGEYNATATLSGEGYKSLTLDAKLIITGADITGISMNSLTVDYDGTEQEIQVEGTLPQGVSVSYTSNKATLPGVYEVKAVLSGEGYTTLTLNATLTINALKITGINFEDQTYTYDGSERELNVTGDTTGFTVVYTTNSGVNAGVYNAKAVISKTGYETLTLNATLTIDKAVLDVSFEDTEVSYDGEEHELLVSGTIPSDAKVVYTNNKGTDQGTYAATVTITSTNYVTYTATANLVIKKSLVDVAKDILSNVFSVPDPWDFLPESFELENRSGTQLDYDNFVSVSSIPTNGIGKQLNVVYDSLVDTQSLLKYVNIVNLSLTAITTAYQNYINQNPDDYSSFSDTEGNLIYTIQLDGNNVEFLIKYLSVSIEFKYDSDTNTNTCRIQLTDSNAIKYETTDTTVSIATNILNVRSSLIVFDFSNENETHGWVYQYTELLGVTLSTTSAYFVIGSAYTTVVSNKKESEDLSVKADVEVYSNSTGQLVGSEIWETIIVTTYDTYWFNMKDVSGITSIKMINDGNSDNSKNEYSVYLNGSSTKFVESTNTFSRKQDIEMRTQYFYNYNSETEEYEKVDITLPMIFVQQEDVTSFSSNFNSANGYSASITANYALVTSCYNALATHFTETVNKAITKADIVAYIGTKDEWFDQ